MSMFASAAAPTTFTFGFPPSLLNINLHLLCELLQLLREVFSLHLLDYLLSSQSIPALYPFSEHHSSIVCTEWIDEAVWSYIMDNTSPHSFYAIVVVIHEVHTCGKY